MYKMYCEKVKIINGGLRFFIYSNYVWDNLSIEGIGNCDVLIMYIFFLNVGKFF